jgi:hypothetical protein
MDLAEVNASETLAVHHENQRFLICLLPQLTEFNRVLSGPNMATWLIDKKQA